MRKQLAVFLAIVLVGAMCFLSLPIGGVSINPSTGYLSISTDVVLAVNTIDKTDSTKASTIGNWTKDGDKVYVNNSKVYLSAEPHTIHSSGWVEFEVISKVWEGKIDAVWGFNGTEARPKRPQIWKLNVAHNVTKYIYCEKNNTLYLTNIIAFDKLDWETFNGTPNIGNTNNTYLYNITTSTNVTQTLTYAFYDYTLNKTDGTGSITYNYDSTCPSYYIEYYNDWVNLPDVLTKVTRDWQRFDTWWCVKGAEVVASKTYKVRVFINIPIKLGLTSGKYCWGIKPHDESISEAIANEHLFLLDPWYDSSYAYRKSFNITNTTAGAQTDYQMKLLVSKNSSSDGSGTVNLSGHCENDFDDIRFTNATGTALDFWEESVNSGDNATVWIEHDSINTTGNTSFYIYYGNATATSASNGTNTFPLFDHFLGDTLDTDKWNSIGTPVVSGGAVHLSNTTKIYAKTGFGFQYAIETRSKADEQDSRFAGFWDTGGGETNRLELANSDTPYPDDFDRFQIVTQKVGADVDYEDNWDDFRDIYAIYRIKRYNGVHTIFEQNAHSYTDDNAVGTIPTIDLYPGVGVWDSSQESTLDCDWLFVRNYVYPEPDWGTWGSEEEQPVGIPTVTNGVGATNVTTTSATLNGNLTDDAGENCTVKVYYGDNDGITTAGNWDTNITIGTNLTNGTFYTDVSNLTNVTYYYRCFANNTAGSDWADSTIAFGVPAISNEPDSYDFEVVDANSTYTTGLTAFNVTNTGDVPVNISIQGTNMTGGTASGIGSEAIDRGSFAILNPSTRVDGTIPADSDGTITSVEIYPSAGHSLTDCKVGIFYTTGTDTFTCRSAETIGNVTGGSKQTFSVSLAVQTGDYIGIYASSGWMERDNIATGPGPYPHPLWRYDGDSCIVSNETTYTSTDANATISLHGVFASSKWTLNDTATPGADIYGLKAGINGTGGGEIAYVNGAGNRIGSGEPIIAAPTTNHTDGNLLVVFVTVLSTTITVSSIADTAGNTYTYVGRVLNGTRTIECWYAKNITGNANNVVTATLSGVTYWKTITVDQYSGCDKSAPFDQFNSGTGAGTAPTTGGITTTAADEVLVAGVYLGVGRTITAGADYTLRTLSDPAPSYGASEDRMVSATGTYSATFALDDTAGWAAIIASFKAAYNITVKEASPYNNLVTNLGVGNSTLWGLKLYTPTSYSDGYEKTGTVTLTATEV